MNDEDKLIEQMNMYYDLRAPWHDEYMSYSTLEKMEQLLRPIVDYIEPYIRNKNILEIACGTGNWTQVLAKRALTVLATDYSPAVLKIAEQKIGGLDNVSIERSDAYSLDNIEGPFNCLFASDWWSHIPIGSIDVFLNTISKKLIPGSDVIFLDMSMIDYFRNEPCFYDKEGNRVSIRKLPDGTEFHVVKNFPTENELRKFIGDFGEDIVYKEFDELKRWLVMFKSVEV